MGEKPVHYSEREVKKFAKPAGVVGSPGGFTPDDAKTVIKIAKDVDKLLNETKKKALSMIKKNKAAEHVLKGIRLDIRDVEEAIGVFSDTKRASVKDLMGEWEEEFA